ncbi:ComEA family DNA-binding protein [Aliikangiella sp. IMCC44632]
MKMNTFKFAVLLIAVLVSNVFSQISLAKSSIHKINSHHSFEDSLKVNLNTAGAEQIAEALTGVGIKKAQAIVAFRNQFGEFKSIEELASVKGIGVLTVVRNESRILLN